MSTTIAISTFQKVDALEGILKSLLDNDYGRFTTVICDDFAGKPYQITRSGNGGHPCWNLPENEAKASVDMPSAIEIFNKYKKEFRRLVLVYGKDRGGISINKNRGIWYFLEKTKDDYLLLLDDDILFHAPGMVEDWIEVLKANTSETQPCYSLNSLCGTWQDYDPGFFDKLRGRPMIESRKAWDADFPIEALGENGLEWRKGSQGCANLFTRKAVEAVGYYDLLGSFYGYEHAIYSSRVNLKVDRRSPVLYGVFDYSAKYFCGNSISNNYNDATTEAAKADPVYQRRLNQEIAMGINLKVKSPGFNIKELTVLE